MAKYNKRMFECSNLGWSSGILEEYLKVTFYYRKRYFEKKFYYYSHITN